VNPRGPQTKGISKQAKKVSVEVSCGRTGGCRRGVSVNRQKGHQGGGDKASRRSAATFQNRIGKEDGTGAGGGRCAAKDEQVYKRVLLWVSRWSGTRDKLKRLGGSQAIRKTIQWGVRDSATAKRGQTCRICRSGLHIPLSAKHERVLRPVSQRATTSDDSLIYPGQCCVRGSWIASEDSGAEGVSYGPHML
jgi:hypothetical protein